MNAMTKPSIASAAPATKPNGLIYVAADAPGIVRRRAGGGFSYLGLDGQVVKAPAVLARIKALAVPPAWTHVSICSRVNGHIQAHGQDARGRRQYIYHPAFSDHRAAIKYEHMIAFAQALPAIRARIEADMARGGLGRDVVLASVAHLLDTTAIRVGNSAYAKANGSFGLTTLRARHVKVEGSQLRFQFKGKSGRLWRLSVKDRRVARVVRACQALPGQDLFQYQDETGAQRTVTSSDVNDYLREAAGREVTAKDFRTWTGTVLAAVALAEIGPASSPTAARRNLAQAIRHVADRLGNTATVCRKCYVHPALIEAYLEDGVTLDLPANTGGEPADIQTAESAVLAFLRSRRAVDGGGKPRRLRG